ncbi:hypothetical protein GCM10027277_51860 [Pseudoduganella ginsengisoli]|uniref:DUF2059 domain-containing protein n=1 Tax=Pseudoduganella ginsengisoli TaxID=1462440 RepID=A0A6L6Q4H5_9BURK|nr:DUF6683 family protein [Pseudoduganella ginsengisoli]MTW04406.1 hypothetical protein [Pseudoduganella ginsengisoli]
MVVRVHGWKSQCAALALAAGAVLPAHAQWLGQDYATYGAPLSSFMQSSVMNNLSMINAASDQSKREQGRRELPLRADGPSAVQRNAAALAQHFPSEHRATMTKAFADSMGVWMQLETKLGLPRNDVGGALAAFLVGNYMVMTGKEVSDEEFGVVVEQLRRQPSLRSTLGGQSPAALRDLYEQSAMTGTFMALAWKSQQTNPQPAAQQANLRHAARENLRTIGLDPDRLHISARGVSLAD